MFKERALKHARTRNGYVCMHWKRLRDQRKVVAMLAGIKSLPVCGKVPVVCVVPCCRNRAHKRVMHSRLFKNFAEAVVCVVPCVLQKQSTQESDALKIV